MSRCYNEMRPLDALKEYQCVLLMREWITGGQRLHSGRVVRIAPHDFYLLVFKPLYNCFPLTGAESVRFFFNTQNIEKVIEGICM